MPRDYRYATQYHRERQRELVVEATLDAEHPEGECNDGCSLCARFAEEA